MAGKNFRSVGAKIALAFALLMPILLYQLGSNAYQAFTSYRTVVTIDRQNAAANNLIAGVYEILMERLATNNALQGADPAGADALKEIGVRRNAAVTKISAAVEDLNAQEFPDKAALVSGLKAAVDKANGYRTKADAAIKHGKAERDADTVKNLFVSLSELSATSQKVWSAVLSNTSRLDPELARLTNLRLLGWNLRDIAGFERSHVGQAISAKTAIPPEKLAEIGGIRAQIALLWRFAQMNLAPNDHRRDQQRRPARQGWLFRKIPAAGRTDAQGFRRRRRVSDVARAMGRHHDAAALHIARNHVRRRRSERSPHRRAVEFGDLVARDQYRPVAGGNWSRRGRGVDDACAALSGRSATCRT